MDGLENLGENLVRLATSLKTMEATLPAHPSDFGFGEAMAKLAEAFGTAFRQAHPVLLSSEEAFVELVAGSEPQDWTNDVGEEHLREAGALVHEGILCSQEIVLLLARIASAGRVNAPMTRQVLQPSLSGFAESTSVIGWELKGISHEFQAEVKLLGRAPRNLKDLGTGSRALAADMANAAGRLRLARREWFRIDHRLASATGAGAAGASREPLPTR